MTIQALGYVGFGSRDLDDWRQFGTGLVGLQPVERGNSLLAFRMDDRKQRIVIDRAMADGERFFGWEVADAAALDALAARLEQAGIEVTAEPRTLADARRVSGLISFRDPAGNRLEAFHGAEIDDTPFAPGRSISGFRTGPLGLGHAVLTVERIDAVMPFYVDVLGFGLSDYILKPFRAYFFHVNARHHSLALIETGKNGMHHLMVELFSLDDVGQCYDIALTQEDRIGVTLGRHTNDFMTSFYAKTPSAFMIECGWGGREVDPSNWQPVEMFDGPSLWGHDRVWLPEKDREVAREMRMHAAASGQRAPVQVMDGNHKLLSGTCPWWDSVSKDAG
jgi:2,3-dihydroxybiphenyl 1,2-dioxygenase